MEKPLPTFTHVSTRARKRGHRKCRRPQVTGYEAHLGFSPRPLLIDRVDLCEANRNGTVYTRHIVESTVLEVCPALKGRIATDVSCYKERFRSRAMDFSNANTAYDGDVAQYRSRLRELVARRHGPHG